MVDLQNRRVALLRIVDASRIAVSLEIVAQLEQTSQHIMIQLTHVGKRQEIGRGCLHLLCFFILLFDFVDSASTLARLEIQNDFSRSKNLNSHH